MFFLKALLYKIRVARTKATYNPKREKFPIHTQKNLKINHLTSGEQSFAEVGGNTG